MARKAPGKAHRKGLSFVEIADMFRDEDAARDWIAEQRWPDGPYCPKCGSLNVQSDIAHKTMTHRCRDCKTGKSKTMFSLKTGTVMEGSNLKYRAWAIGIYLFTTNLKGVSSMKLHRELGISQKAAWFMLHRLRLALEAETGPFAGPVEADETFIGGKRHNMSKSKRAQPARRGGADKAIIAGVKDRASNKIAARHVPDTSGETLKGFVRENAAPDAMIFTDENVSYKGLPRHETVRHTRDEYVNPWTGASTQGIESFWAMFKRGYQGCYHKMSPKHLDRYVAEFSGRHNARDADTIDQMTGIVEGMAGKRLRYEDLTADNGLDSGARK